MEICPVSDNCKCQLQMASFCVITREGDTEDVMFEYMTDIICYSIILLTLVRHST